MPTYNYKCTDIECNYKFEVVQKMTEKPIKHCPACEKDTRRVIHASGFKIGGVGAFGNGRV